MNVTGTLTEKYILMKGSQCATTTIDVTLEAVGVTQTWIPRRSQRRPQLQVLVRLYMRRP